MSSLAQPISDRGFAKPNGKFLTYRRSGAHLSAAIAHGGTINPQYAAIYCSTDDCFCLPASR
jgi:hypothetical protein